MQDLNPPSDFYLEAHLGPIFFFGLMTVSRPVGVEETAGHHPYSQRFSKRAGGILSIIRLIPT